MKTVIDMLLVCVLVAVVGQALSQTTPSPAGNTTDSPPSPCCFPSSFQATVADVTNAVHGQMRLFEVYRDWDRRIQVQKALTFAPPGQVARIQTIFLDFNNSVQHVVSASGDCHSSPLEWGMLEPCMPANASFLGNAYLGFGEDKTEFQTWSFQRADLGRNLSMTVSATLRDCAPVFETITGTLGHSRVNAFLMFTTFNEVQDDSVFDVPRSCTPST